MSRTLLSIAPLGLLLYVLQPEAEVGKETDLLVERTEVKMTEQIGHYLLDV